MQGLTAKFHIFPDFRAFSESEKGVLIMSAL